MKCIALSDFHGQLINIKENFDLLLICGDFTPTWLPNRQQEWAWANNEFVEWINNLPYKDYNSRVVLIAGNHDFQLESISKKKKDEWLSKMGGRLIYLDNDSFYHLDQETGKVIHIFGCPYCKELKGWAFCRPLERLDKYYNPIPNDVDILMLHDAPDIMHGGVSTQLVPNRDFGNKLLAEYVFDRKPQIVLFGHIHTSPIKEFTQYMDDKVMCNVSILDENYKIAYEPKTFILD